MIKRATYFFGIVGVLLFVLSVIVAGYLYPNYSHFKQLISESYATGTDYGFSLRWYGFIPSGLFLMVFGFLAPFNFPKSKILKLGFYGIAIFYGLGTLITGLFPCDFGCNKDFINPSLSQLIHNLSGTLTYLIVPICLLVLTQKLKSFILNKGMFLGLIVLSFTAILCTVVLFANYQMTYIGLAQRLIEGSILTWIALICLILNKYS